MPHFRKMFDDLREGVQIIDTAWRYIYVNKAFLQHMSMPSRTVIGRTVTETFPAIEGTELLLNLEQCMVQRTTHRIQNEVVYPDKSTRWFESSIEPCDQGIIILSHDITIQKTVVEKLNNFKNLYAFISQVNQSIVRIRNDKALFRSSCRIAIEFGKFRIAWIGIFDKGAKNLLVAEQAGIPASETLRFSSIDFMSSGPLKPVLEEGSFYICNDIEKEMEPGDLKSFLLQYGIHSVAVIPIRRAGLLAGCFSLYSIERNFWDERETSLLLELRGDISNAVDQFLDDQRNAEAERLVMLNERHFRALIEKSSDMISLVKADGELIYVSPSVTKVLGYSMEELRNKRDDEFIHPDDIGIFKKHVADIAAVPGASFSNEQRLLHKNGYWIWCEGTVTNLLQQPAIQAIVSNFRDVSEKKAMQQQSAFNRSNLRALINNTTDLMWSVGRDFNLITSNRPFDKRVQTMYGKPLSKGESVLETSLTDAEASRLKELYERAFHGESFTEIEYVEQPMETWSETSYSPIRKDDEVIGTACHSRDVTELKKSEAFSRAVLNALGSQIAVVDAEGYIVAVNESWRRFAAEYGDTVLQQTGVGINYFHVCANSAAAGDRTATEVLNGLKNVLDEVTPIFYFEYPCHWNNRLRWFSMRVMRFENREPMIVVAHEEISERKQAEMNLRQNNEELQKTNQELDRFVYSASHDLRSPLTSILGLLNIMELESHDASVLSYSGMIRTSVIRLDEFVKNILGYSRNNRTEMEITFIPVRKTVDDVLSLLSNMKGAEKIKVTLDIEEDIPFYSDIQRFNIVLENLISNAVKFQNPATVVPQISISAQVDEGYLTLRVEDNGIGIPTEYHSRIFDMFFRLPGTTAGSGIGLYIVKETIEKLQGTIQVQSTDNKGTVFVLRIRNQGVNHANVST